MTKRTHVLIPIIIVAFIVVIVGVLSVPTDVNLELVEEKPIHADIEFRVAFIGDQGLGPDAITVLNLIKDEGAQMVLHQGDFDYADNPDAWDGMISDVLGSDFPYFASIGNHDVIELSGYQEKLYDRLEKNPDVVCNGDLGVKSSCTYKGLFFILAAPGLVGSDYDSFIEKQLSDNDSTWKVCSWHHDYRHMIDLDLKVWYTGVEGFEYFDKNTGWEVYENCKNAGAIIANAHMHNYHRTQTLINIENQNVDPEWSEPNKLRVDEGATFAFISGLGGKSSNPGVYPGALFCIFNVGEQPNKAYCYFKNIGGKHISGKNIDGNIYDGKNIDGKIIDKFTITSFLGSNTDNTNFTYVDMSGWDLTDYDFSNKVIVDTNLSNAVLTGADLSNVVFFSNDTNRI